jgi:hypothetical protein
MGLQRRADRGDQVQPSGAPPRLKFKRGADGALQVDDPEAGERKTSTEPAERPPTPDDPRTAPAYFPHLGGS